MGRHLLFLLFLLSCCAGPLLMAQQASFVGRIDYQNSFASTNPDLPVAWMKAAMGERASLYLFPEGYFEDSDSKLGWEKQWFFRDEGRVYFQQAGIDTLYWLDVSAVDDSLFEAKMEAETEEILGHECQVLNTLTNKGRKRYFFSPDLHLPSDYYASFKAGHKDEIHRKMRAPYLKLEMEYQGITTLMTAVDIQPMKKIPKKITRLPKKLPRREWVR